jgi:hypothetical protein
MAFSNGPSNGHWGNAIKKVKACTQGLAGGFGFLHVRSV